MAWSPEQAAAYAAANPDVWKSYQNDPQNQGLTLQQAMEGHYNNYGKAEGRTAPTASQEYATQNLSPYISAGIQNSTNVYDLNGRPVTLGAGQRVTGGSLNGNVIYNADGTSAGNYYTSPEDAAYWRQRTQQAMGGSAVVGGGMTLEQQRQNLQNTLNTGGIDTGVTKPAGNTTGGPAHEISGWSGPALESQGFLSQLMQMMQQMQGGGQAQQAYSPQQQYNPYGQQGYNPFGSMYGNYNPFGSQYSSYTQPMQSTGGAAAPGQMVTQSYTPSNNVSNSATQGGQAGSFSPGYMPYDMGFRQGNMPNFGPLSQLQANAMYA